MGRQPSDRPWLRVRGFGDDDRGSFMVLEAILVALLVLTAVLFFTSVQRPSTGSDQGGLDLAQVSADTLAILGVRTFNDVPPGVWLTNLMHADSGTGCNAAAPTATQCPTATEIQEFLGEILPTGSRYSLRLDNGLATLPLLPLGSVPEPHAGRASQEMFTAPWDAFSGKTATDGAAPGEALTPSAHPTLSRFTDPNPSPSSDRIQCIKAPTSLGATGSIGPGGSTWASVWQATAATLTGLRTAGNPVIEGLSSTATLEVGMRVQGNAGIPAGASIQAILSSTSIQLSQAADTGAATPTTLTFTANRVPAAALYGTWEAHTSSNCSDGSPLYAKVWRPQFRTIAASLSTSTPPGTLSCGSPCFTSLDVGLPVIGAGIQADTRIASISDPNSAVLSQAPATTGATTAQLPSYSPYATYGLQLVVWFGA